MKIVILIISEVFEHCVLNRFDKFFWTGCNQFGFKKGDKLQ